MSRNGFTGIKLAAILGSAFVAGMIAPASCQASALSKHNTIQELRNLPVNSAVHLIGVITYVDEQGKLFWLKDETGAMPIRANPLPAGVLAGEEVAIEAFTTLDASNGPSSVGLQKIRVHPTAHKDLVPSPEVLTGTASAPVDGANPPSQQRRPADLTVVRSIPSWTPPAIAVMTVILAFLIVGILLVLAQVNKLRRRLSEQA
ncbi:MAG: hypothetical protein WCC27_11260, partial [Acidobacteriaceae bacterium]